MAKIFVKGNREPFDVPLDIAEQIKEDWFNDSVSRNKKISFSYFIGTLDDIKSFDMRTEVSRSDYERPDDPPPTKEQREKMETISQEIRNLVDKFRVKK